LITENRRKKRGKKIKNQENEGFLRDFLKNGVVGNTKNGDFIGLLRF
jgi:hypothetical protein